MKVISVLTSSFLPLPQADIDYLTLGLALAEKRKDGQALDAFKLFVDKVNNIKDKDADKLKFALFKIAFRSKNKDVINRCYILQAELFLRLGDISTAISKFQFVSKRMPRNATLPLRLGQIYEGIVDRKTAIQYYDSTIEIANKYPTPENKKACVKATEAREKNLKILKSIENSDGHK
jgi:tetratricopeptide (TPR) repeat protein